MNEEHFIERNNWVRNVPDPQHHYSLIFHTNKHLGRTALKGFASVRDVLSRDVSFRRPTKLISPAITKKASAFYDRLSNLKKLVKISHEILASSSTVMLPVNMFPDTIVVDRTKITITKRTFFWSASVIGIRIEDVLNVGISTGPLFGSLTISSRVMNSTDHFEVNYLWRKDAEKLKHIIQGYIIAQHNSIDTKDLSREELIETLLEIGCDSE
ncbi:MAG: hypothetical protein ABIQ04_02060 [Candidatus Saccharimonadales bacterium]